MHGITIESILDPNHVETVPDSNQAGSYRVTFRIKFETSMGQSLALIGDVAELGTWKDFSKA